MGVRTRRHTQLPDWSGLWTRADRGGPFVGPGPGGLAPKLTASALAKLQENAELAARGAAYQENISDCGPPGYPRWLNIPFLREFIVRPEQTWLSSETVNNVRRIYTDGRAHSSPAEPSRSTTAIRSASGTAQTRHPHEFADGRSIGRGQPTQSEQMETVEIWEKLDARTIKADVWIYDPDDLHRAVVSCRGATRRWPTPTYSFRMNYWHCGENPNNEVYKTPEGSTQFKDFTFTR